MIKNSIISIAFILFVLISTNVYADNYYNYSTYNANAVNYPVVQCPVVPFATYSTYPIPVTRYEWVPVYTQQVVVKPAPMYGFPFTRQPTQQTVIQWNFIPVTRY
jgi:hypothetical protein